MQCWWPGKPWLTGPLSPGGATDTGNARETPGLREQGVGLVTQEVLPAPGHILRSPSGTACSRFRGNSGKAACEPRSHRELQAHLPLSDSALPVPLSLSLQPPNTEEFPWYILTGPEHDCSLNPAPVRSAATHHPPAWCTTAHSAFHHRPPVILPQSPGSAQFELIARVRRQLLLCNAPV